MPHVGGTGTQGGRCVRVQRGAAPLALRSGDQVDRASGGPSTTLCVAVDRAGDVMTSTDPAGPASSWVLHHVEGSYILDGTLCR